MIGVKTKTKPSFAEFVTLVSMMMALTALSIDAMLPALPHIASDRPVADRETSSWGRPCHEGQRGA